MKDLHEEKQKLFESEAFPLMDALYNTALKLTYNEDDAKDLVQDTFFKGFRFLHQFEQGTSMHAWLYRIMKNTFINNYRKKVKQPSKVDFNEVEPFIDTISLDKDFTSEEIEHILNNSLSDDVNKAMMKLPEEFRLVLILSDMEGFSYKEIADIMEIPIGTVRSRLSRARKAMFSKLANNKKFSRYSVSCEALIEQNNGYEENPV
ncbi:MAG: sigma-70 family RNA polymerase sigma factor [bacterium]|nr:sigma-70 family RNA polymerase sigma factor [bacterium]